VRAVLLRGECHAAAPTGPMRSTRQTGNSAYDERSLFFCLEDDDDTSMTAIWQRDVESRAQHMKTGFCRYQVKRRAVEHPLSAHWNPRRSPLATLAGLASTPDMKFF